ncbi:MAG: cytochrome b N-terminal domain-containing protein [Candidatus Sumerlaeota bacterium]|nr:cytochrome b N-terminal domain-containing protein [Candidatus Sumerlaeota bacterium]
MAPKTLPSRIGWEEHLKPFLYKELPARTGWTATLGSLCALLFGVTAVTGVFLAMYYNPSPDKAYQSIDYIMNDVPMGALLRGIHHWGASAMVLAVFLHLLTNFFSGTLKAPRELTWILGVCLFLVTLGFGFTGYLLPWDMKSYWATVVSTNIPRAIPVFGDLIARIGLGGDSVSGLTLTRFYAIHMLLLPALLVMLAAFHIYLVRIHGLAETNEKEEEESGDGRNVYRFYPEHAFRSAIVFVAVFLAILVLSLHAPIPREEIAGTLKDNYLPRPEWYYMWLFQLLTYFPGKWEVVGSLAIPILGVAALFLAPFLGRSRLRGVGNRPLAMATGVSCVVAIVYLTAMGFAGARPYGEIIPVPARPLTADEARGLFLYVDRDCAYCHQIDGKGGRRIGPDLANVIAKKRTKDYLGQYIADPQAVKSASIMPKYDLPKSDLHSLAEFLLALDFHAAPMNTLKRDEALRASPAPQNSLNRQPREAAAR